MALFHSIVFLSEPGVRWIRLTFPAYANTHRESARYCFACVFSTATVLLQNLKPQNQNNQQIPLDASTYAPCNALTEVHARRYADVLQTYLR